MTKRVTSLRYPESAIADGKFGTATVRESLRPAMTAAQLAIFKKTGNPPQTSALDDIDLDDPFEIKRPSLVDQMAARKKPAKYRNTKCESEGIKFDSKREMARWHELVQMQARGEIRDLRLQVPFVLTERKRRDDGTWERAWKYVADFVYVDVTTGKQIVEDVKSEITRKNAAYVRARKAMLAIHDISILETI
ncbi:DUF1064 domain-containing protein [Paraburkholderia terrae]|uniref:DUF1064 domain-containing protein n=1 Tax=Paraburkholderia terrae TaxID=311230 RepID=UPI001EE1796E|nr:DUF1064 domain-containing protein [Paraburkholderia terrae]GJH05014.1 DUF1064 domain-containing protein [Paraburkholderia terrae]